MAKIPTYAEQINEYTAMYLDLPEQIDDTIEDLLTQAQQNGMKVTFEVGPLLDGNRLFAARVTPFTQTIKQEVMTIGRGYTLAEGLYAALTAVEAEIWCQLDWSVRPWVVTPAGQRKFTLTRRNG